MLPGARSEIKRIPRLGHCAVHFNYYKVARINYNARDLQLSSVRKHFNQCVLFGLLSTVHLLLIIEIEILHIIIKHLQPNRTFELFPTLSNYRVLRIKSNCNFFIQVHVVILICHRVL